MIRKCRICGTNVENIMEGRMVIDDAANVIFWVHEACWKMKNRVMEGTSTFFCGHDLGKGEAQTQ